MRTRTRTAPRAAARAAAYDVWHTEVSRLLAELGLGARDFDASDFEAAYSAGLSAAAFAADLVEAWED